MVILKRGHCNSVDTHQIQTGDKQIKSMNLLPHLFTISKTFVAALSANKTTYLYLPEHMVWGLREECM